jgi:hypothetical protein
MDMIPCDESMIHSDILKQLKGEEPQHASIMTCQSEEGTSQPPIPTETPPTVGHTKISVRLRSRTEFSQADANHIYEQMVSEKKLARKTVSNYIASLDKILKMFNCPTDNIIPCLRCHEHILTILRRENPNTDSYKNMLSCLLSLAKHSTLFAQALGQDIVDIYKQEMIRVRDLIVHESKEKADHGVAKSWVEIIEMRKHLCEQKPDSLEYLILCLYTMIPPMRDDFGKVLLVVDEHGTEIPPEEPNVYFVKTRRLVIGQYKTGKHYGIIDINLPVRLQTIIKRSIELRPRKYLITQRRFPDLVYDPVKGGKLSAIIEHLFGFGIDDLRHSFDTYLDQHRHNYSISERRIIYYIMGHSAGMSEFYARQGTKESKEIEVTEIKPNTTEIETIFNKIGGNI